MVKRKPYPITCGDCKLVIDADSFETAEHLLGVHAAATHARECSRCRGLGVVSERRCWTCHGSGRSRNG